MRRLAFVAMGDLLLSAAALQSQTPPAFDAAAIKPGVKDGSTGARLEGARYTAANYTLIGLLTIAYGMKPYQISGRPGLTNSSWIDSDRYTIVARMPDGADGDQRFRMLQALLADRFRLKIHREMTDLPAYALTVDKGGPKLKRKRSEGEAIGVDRLGRRGAPAAGAASGQYEYTAARIDFLAARGSYDFALPWTPETIPSFETGPSIFTALTETIVVDNAERPILD